MTREEAITILKANYPDACFEQLRNAVDMAIFTLKQSEIIRCKDCKHKPKLNENGVPEFPTGKCPCQVDDFYTLWIPKDDWFCGNAERREG